MGIGCNLYFQCFLNNAHRQQKLDRIRNRYQASALRCQDRDMNGCPIYDKNFVPIPLKQAARPGPFQQNEAQT